MNNSVMIVNIYATLLTLLFVGIGLLLTYLCGKFPSIKSVDEVTTTHLQRLLMEKKLPKRITKQEALQQRMAKQMPNQ